MAELKTYRHRVTGRVGTYPPEVKRAMGDVLEEVKPGAKPKVKLTDLVSAGVEESAKPKGRRNNGRRATATR